MVDVSPQPKNSNNSESNLQSEQFEELADSQEFNFSSTPKLFQKIIWFLKKSTTDKSAMSVAILTTITILVAVSVLIFQPKMGANEPSDSLSKSDDSQLENDLGGYSKIVKFGSREISDHNDNEKANVVESPTPSPSPTITSTEKYNLVFHSDYPRIHVERIMPDLIQSAPENSVVSTPDKTSFYYRYEQITNDYNLNEFVDNKAILNQGDKLSTRVVVENEGEITSPEQTIMAILTYSDGTEAKHGFWIPALDPGQQSPELTFLPEMVYSIDTVYSKSGKVKMQWILDSNNSPDQDVSTNKIIEFQYSILPDKTPPYLEIYDSAIRQVNESGSKQVCYDPRQVHTRDNLDAVDGENRSRRTEIRYKTDGMPFSEWDSFDQHADKYFEKQCKEAIIGELYFITFESRDETNNITSLTKSIIAQ